MSIWMFLDGDCVFYSRVLAHDCETDQTGSLVLKNSRSHKSKHTHTHRQTNGVGGKGSALSQCSDGNTNPLTCWP